MNVFKKEFPMDQGQVLGSFGGKSNSLIIYHKEESTFHLKESGYFSNIFRLSKHGVSFGSGLNCILDYGGSHTQESRQENIRQKKHFHFLYWNILWKNKHICKLYFLEHLCLLLNIRMQHYNPRAFQVWRTVQLCRN